MTGVFPEELIGFWATGEQSGYMDEMLDRLATLYEDRWRRSLDQVAAWFPRIAYVFVAAYVIYQIFTMYTAYFSQYNDLLK